MFYVVRNGEESAASMPHLGNVPDGGDVYEGAVDDVGVQHEGHVVHRALAAGPGVAAQHLVLAEHLHTPVDKYIDVCRYIYQPWQWTSCPPPCRPASRSWRSGLQVSSTYNQ